MYFETNCKQILSAAKTAQGTDEDAVGLRWSSRVFHVIRLLGGADAAGPWSAWWVEASAVTLAWRIAFSLGAPSYLPLTFISWSS